MWRRLMLFEMMNIFRVPDVGNNYRPSSRHGVVGSDGIRRCMVRVRWTIGFGVGSSASGSGGSSDI